MFTAARSFEQDLCGWDVEYTRYGVTYTDMTYDCYGAGALCGNSDDGYTCV